MSMREILVLPNLQHQHASIQTDVMQRDVMQKDVMDRKWSDRLHLKVIELGAMITLPALEAKIRAKVFSASL
jgi:hypothetical protein